MTTLISGDQANFSVKVQLDGVAVPVTGTVTASVMKMDGRTTVVPDFTPTTNASWANGIIPISMDSTMTGLIDPGDAMLVLRGSFGIRRFALIVETLLSPTRTSLFIRDIAIGQMRADSLMAAAAGALGNIKVSDDYIWEKVRAAESQISHTLRVPLVPTRFFPNQPTQEEIDALDGLAWEVEVGSDYDPTMFERDKWGFIITRQRPIISIERMRFVYPTQSFGYYDIPREWLTFDAKYGHIRIVPTSSAVLTGMAGFVMTNLAQGRVIPSMIQYVYTAGLTDVARNYPELLDAIRKEAVLKIVTDKYLPQSGSISADGLSQSMSVDMDKYRGSIDHILNGGDGSNGGLMAKIHGIRMVIM
jgi:hypothetical protein